MTDTMCEASACAKMDAEQILDAFRAWAGNLTIQQYQSFRSDLMDALRAGGGKLPPAEFEAGLIRFREKWQPIIGQANRKARGIEKRRQTILARKAVLQ